MKVPEDLPRFCGHARVAGDASERVKTRTATLNEHGRRQRRREDHTSKLSSQHVKKQLQNMRRIMVACITICEL
jgi:hypothetical protein